MMQLAPDDGATTRCWQTLSLEQIVEARLTQHGPFLTNSLIDLGHVPSCGGAMSGSVA